MTLKAMLKEEGPIGAHGKTVVREMRKNRTATTEKTMEESFQEGKGDTGKC